SDTCTAIQCGERVMICKHDAYAQTVRLEGRVESILAPFSPEAKALQAFTTGGLMVTDGAGERVFVAWSDRMDVVRR
ncbi:MAG: hypothetical protein IKT85_06650, partial [Kiritimatiellae bacterium]|nr:hypothetical protein [Kiritimatiellia bacterium]